VPWAALVVPLAVLAVQDTRWSLLPADREPALWATVLLAFAGAIVLRAGWLHESRTARRQEELFTASNSFYEPRRRAMTESGAVIGGLAGALWWGVTAWIVLGHALWRGAGTRGLFELETAVIVGAIAGTIDGAVLGRAAGWVWERRHRRRRMRVVRGGRSRG
jgi:hypothetical protein